jgi:hypothetical protein
MMSNTQDLIERLRMLKSKLGEDAADELERLLAERDEARREWIPVTEKLPNTDADVLVHHILGDRDRCPRACDVAAYINGEWIFPWDRGQLNPPPDWVTHWMPLPEPPIRALLNEQRKEQQQRSGDLAGASSGSTEAVQSTTCCRARSNLGSGDDAVVLRS